MPWPDLPLILKTNGLARARPPFSAVEPRANSLTKLVFSATGGRVTPTLKCFHGDERRYAAPRNPSLPALPSSPTLLPASLLHVGSWALKEKAVFSLLSSQAPALEASPAC